MFIVPITPITPMNGISEVGKIAKSAPASGEEQFSFSSILQDAIKNVKETSAAENTDAYNLTIGNSDNLHDLQINQEKAYLSIELLQSVRNKMLDSYKEIMNMGV
ncbi:flagellar hook-basal body complex protein FliE [Acetanaerobacterium elongatum]|uniref:Flagellar hook-basal body complex protein FliE n=1 Tax=Acetanaerobacterium elongatum TaxID=258515 RepID=A0A1G9ZGS8_9FIRM|nr:flagellar hook-basal body complex protein FliE [Acetanaerobacterium elongatum]SDN20509.1 flagellar hook-basal body complex protein FliE [Acetanaerobacterium elongatum]